MGPAPVVDGFFRLSDVTAGFFGPRTVEERPCGAGRSER